jgi:hypothetical protein
MTRDEKEARYGQPVRDSELFLIMRGSYVTSWSPDRKFARSCAGKGERVVKVSY